MCTQVISDAEAEAVASKASHDRAAESAAAAQERVEASQRKAARLQQEEQQACTALSELLKQPPPLSRAQRDQQNEGWRAVEGLRESQAKLEEELAAAHAVSQCSSQRSA